MLAMQVFYTSASMVVIASLFAFSAYGVFHNSIQPDNTSKEAGAALHLAVAISYLIWGLLMFVLGWYREGEYIYRSYVQSPLHI